MAWTTFNYVKLPWAIEPLEWTATDSVKRIIILCPKCGGTTCGNPPGSPNWEGSWSRGPINVVLDLCMRTPIMRFLVEPPEQESPLDPYTEGVPCLSHKFDFSPTGKNLLYHYGAGYICLKIYAVCFGVEFCDRSVRASENHFRPEDKISSNFRSDLILKLWLIVIKTLLIKTHMYNCPLYKWPLYVYPTTVLHMCARMLAPGHWSSGFSCRLHQQWIYLQKQRNEVP